VVIKATIKGVEVGLPKISLHHDNDGNTRRTLEEPTPCSLLELLDKNNGGGIDDNVSELEKDLLLAFEEQEKSSLSSKLLFELEGKYLKF